MTFTKKYSLISQILFWCIIWTIIRTVFISGYGDLISPLIRDIPLFLCLFILLPLNTKVFIPSFCFRKKYFWYILISIGSILLAVYLLYNDYWPWLDWLDNMDRRPKEPRGRRGTEFGSPIISFRWVSRVTPIIIAYLANTLIELAKYADYKEKVALELEKEKISTDLLFLKSQINPHFLFNAMNNLYSLAITKSSHTAESIMQLSEILRYMVYDSNETTVSLKKEIQYIKNFINLMMLKDSRGMNVKYKFDEPTEDIMIAPLLFIPFVENAFKHSFIEDLKEGYINIQLKIYGSKIRFVVENSIPSISYTKDKVGGVGLKNIQKRLELLYPDGLHKLDITQNESKFEIKLNISL